jgi:hypothetical protein
MANPQGPQPFQKPITAVTKQAVLPTTGYNILPAYLKAHYLLLMRQSQSS